MNTVSTVLTITIPTFVVLVGILLNRQDYQRLTQQFHQDMMLIMARLSDLDSRLSRVEERIQR
jgi:hypothetical protein